VVARRSLAVAHLPVHLDEPVQAVLVSLPPQQEEVPDRDLASTDAHVRGVLPSVAM